ncbi:hypothetical protein T11_17243 [Trichinella zimbabwensis]|uniref:Uncharacterized protein n=1 Tax=Trichinella zimbabwensis TaxID=268475 RepID=A0A0V1F8E8_9BILA|nr:hypothetical protein T11_17243 [Trichinella zimbabwensis]
MSTNSCYAHQINYVLASNYMRFILQVINCPQLQFSAKTRSGDC